MAKIRATIEFENSDGTTRRYETEISGARDRATDKSDEELAKRTFAELQKDIHHGNAIEKLSDARGLYKIGKHKFPVEKVFSGAYYDEMNSQNVWLEIQNRMHDARFLLSSAKGYKQLEPPHADDFDQNHFLYGIHFAKMSHFDLGVFRLSKVEDLLLRLLFEGTGAEIISMERKNWDRQLIWDRVRDALKDRASIEKLATMENAEYERLLGLIRDFRNPSFVQTFLEYRDRLAHRITPPVDYPELYTHVEDRAWDEVRDAQGRVIGRKKGYAGLPTRAEFQFDDLHQVATKTYEHYLNLLRELRKISILDPPVLPIEEG